MENFIQTFMLLVLIGLNIFTICNGKKLSQEEENELSNLEVIEPYGVGNSYVAQSNGVKVTANNLVILFLVRYYFIKANNNKIELKDLSGYVKNNTLGNQKALDYLNGSVRKTQLTKAPNFDHHLSKLISADLIAQTGPFSFLTRSGNKLLMECYMGGLEEEIVKTHWSKLGKL